MAIRKINPITPGQRNMTVLDYKKNLTIDNSPEKSLLVSLVKQGGRNNQGKITTRHQGNGHKRKYRIIDFKRNKDNIVGTVKTIEYDPNRNANICLISYLDGEKRYILAPKGIKVDDKILSGENSDVVKIDIITGNCLPLSQIPQGTVVHNVELKAGKGGQMARSAGGSVQILGRDETANYTLLKLGSGEVRKVLSNCRATIGVVGNEDFNLVNIGKAGRNRWKGIRPTVRGSVMNPNDHPHGGGEGKAPIGIKAPVTPWGKKALGLKTRDTKKASNKLIVRRRNATK